ARKSVVQFTHQNSEDPIAPIEDVNFNNNLIYNTTRSGTPITSANVILYENGRTTENSEITVSNQVYANPLLTSEYLLTPTSPARGAGEDGVDIGAFAFEEGDTLYPTAIAGSNQTIT